MTRYLAAAIIALLVAIAYVAVCYHFRSELDHKGQAALVGISVFSFVTSIILLYDVSRYPDEKLGSLSKERGSLIFVCIYVPLSVGGTFMDAATAQPPRSTIGDLIRDVPANAG